MTGLPHPWGMYALQQQKLARRSTIDDYAWGLEAGLNAICAPASPVANVTDLVRMTASAARRDRDRASRYRRRSLEISGSTDWLAAGCVDGCSLLEARSELRRLQLEVRTADLMLLVTVALGHDGCRTATALAITPEALRARLSRARRFARGVLA